MVRKFRRRSKIQSEKGAGKKNRKRERLELKMSKKKNKKSRNRKDENLCGIITREQQIKAMKARSTDYQMPKCGYHMTEKDRPRKKNWRKLE